MNPNIKTKFHLPRLTWLDYALIFWLLFLLYLVFIPPFSLLSYIFFFLSIGLAVFTSLIAIKYHLKLNLIITLCLISLLILRLLNLFSPLNIALVTSLYLVFYFIL